MDMVEVISCLRFYTNENQKKGGFDNSCDYNRVLLYPFRSGTAVTGHATVAARVVSIEFSAQLLFVDSPLPTFFCFISCSVFVPLKSPSSVAYADVENIPVNAAAIKTVAMAIVLFIVLKCSL
jgi:hypothetical protein